GSRRRADLLRAGASRLEAAASAAAEPRPLSVDRRGFDLIAEIKPRSPAAGALTRGLSMPRAAARGRLYEQAGALAISVLTEPESFGGSLALLEEVASATSLPVMRKDFLVDPLQVLEARVHGAAGVLLIVRLLGDAQLAEMLDAARRARLFCLLEAFDEQDLERIGGVGIDSSRVLVGINCRDLDSLAVRPTRFELLAPRAPAGCPLVAESGVVDPEGAATVARCGYRALLVGTALMRSAEPEAAIAAMLAAGRAEVGR
ncbi:MAG TPA: indole-3-glycerol-phosphate synthase, partial [Acidobacteria bacterium]|nr:indole-3-glycerol-phosphate synthase [Acidobacteriota bacterium]